MAKATCVIDGCDRRSKSRGWCHAHYMRWHERGDVGEGSIRPWGGERQCAVEGCVNPYESVGYCAPHRKRIDKYGTPGSVDIRPRVIPDDEVTYVLMHRRLKDILGSASRHACVDCSGRAQHWSYDHKCPDERVDPELGYAFSLKTEHYQPRCASCHARFDGRGNSRSRNPLGQFA